MIELPPSISNIYATAVAINDTGSRFSQNTNAQQQPPLANDCSQPNSSRKLYEKP